MKHVIRKYNCIWCCCVCAYSKLHQHVQGYFLNCCEMSTAEEKLDTVLTQLKAIKQKTLMVRGEIRQTGKRRSLGARGRDPKGGEEVERRLNASIQGKKEQKTIPIKLSSVIIVIITQ